MKIRLRCCGRAADKNISSKGNKYKTRKITAADSNSHNTDYLWYFKNQINYSG